MTSVQDEINLIQRLDVKAVLQTLLVAKNNNSVIDIRVTFKAHKLLLSSLCGNMVNSTNVLLYDPPLFIVALDIVELILGMAC